MLIRIALIKLKLYRILMHIHTTLDLLGLPVLNVWRRGRRHRHTLRWRWQADPSPIIAVVRARWWKKGPTQKRVGVIAPIIPGGPVVGGVHRRRRWWWWGKQMRVVGRIRVRRVRRISIGVSIISTPDIAPPAASVCTQ